MTKTLSRIILIFFMLLGFLLPNLVQAQSATVAPSPSATPTSTSTTTLNSFRLIPLCLRTADKAATADVSCITESIKYYTNMLLIVIAVAAFIYMLYGAFLYTSAFGDENKIKQAKKTITYALAGMILATLAYTIVAILSNILGVAPPSA